MSGSACSCWPASPLPESRTGAGDAYIRATETSDTTVKVRRADRTFLAGPSPTITHRRTEVKVRQRRFELFMTVSRSAMLLVAAFALTVPHALLARTDAPTAADTGAASGRPVPSPLVATAAETADSHAQTDLFGRALDTIRQNYNGEVNATSLTTIALKAMAGSLDGHSLYMSPEEFRDFQATATGEFAGIGAVIEVAGDRLRVIAPTDAGPAAKAGIGPGWEIRRIDGKPVDGLSLAEATRQLRGAAGSKVTVTFRDPGGRETTRTLTRETIHLHSVYHRRIGAVGYIHITGFSRVTDRELAEAQDALQSGTPLTGLILDLRNNTGGFMDAAVQVASRFLKPGDVVVRTGKSAAATTPLYALDQNGALRTLPVVVLVNGGSASAAEIVAAALQDNHRASLVGLVTFGKGLVQTIYPIDDGARGALSITTMRYYTPSGRSIQRIGVAPDLMVGRTDTEAEAAVKPGAGFSEAAIYKAPANEMQLQRIEPDVVEGPPPPYRTPEAPLFRTPVPDDDEIAADFQIERALDVLAAGGIEAARALRPVRLHHRATPGAVPAPAGKPR